MEESLLEILCCPVTRQSLRFADAATLRLVGERSAVPLAEGLVREDGRVVYPIKNGIPLLVADEAIPVSP